MQQGVPITTMNNELPPLIPLVDLLNENPGALDIMSELIARHFSILNNGTEKYVLYSKCFKDLEPFEAVVKNITDKLSCSDFSAPPLKPKITQLPAVP